MFGLRMVCSEHDALQAQLRDERDEHAFRRRRATLDRVVAIHQHFRLDDGNDPRSWQSAA